MKKLKDFLKEEQEHNEKELTTADSIVDAGIDKEEKRKILDDAEEVKRLKEEKDRIKEENSSPE
tara:strand:+ start:539 stop:730 length:192 start_codon:yes stop_codon:yes gene_type:complete